MARLLWCYLAALLWFFSFSVLNKKMAPKTHICGVCDEQIGRKNCIQCDVCNLWIHQSCANLSDSELEMLSKNKSFKFICVKCTNKISQGNTMVDDFRALNAKLDEVIKKGKDDTESMKEAFEKAVANIKSDMENFASKVTSDCAALNNRVNSLEAVTDTRISSLEIENHVLYRRINRANIVVRGLPAGLPDLVAVAVALGNSLNVALNTQDLSHVSYINSKRLVLVVFNSVIIRDRIMKQYFKTRTLKISDVIGDVLINIDTGTNDGKESTRVYLNDHYSPAASKLNATCRKLVQEKLIKKYKIFNYDKLRAVLTLANGKELEVFNVADCVKLRGDDTPVLG